MAIKDIVKIVSEYYKLEEVSVYEKTRKKEIVKARQVVMYLLREDFSGSYPYIGQKFGGRDHTTAIHAVEKIGQEINKNSSLNQKINHSQLKLKYLSHRYKQKATR